MWTLIGVVLTGGAAGWAHDRIDGPLTLVMVSAPAIFGLGVAGLTLGSPSPPGPWLRRGLYGLLWSALIVCALDTFGFPPFLLPLMAFAIAIGDVGPPLGVTILGRAESSMASREALGAVRQTYNVFARVGASSVKATLRAFGYWTPNSLGSSWVDVAIMDGGMTVTQSRGGFYGLMAQPPFPEIRLRWAEIQSVQVFTDILKQWYRLNFYFPGGEGFSLWKPMGQNNLVPLVYALEAHGVRVAGRTPATGQVGQPQWSADRRWWWDGRQWIPGAAIEQQRWSPDGRWWWDGSQWRPAGGQQS